MAEIEKLNEIAIKVGKLETGWDASVRATNELAASVNRLVEKMDTSDDIAREAGQRARAAHYRLDEARAEFDKKLGSVQEDIKWLWRTVLTTIITSGISGLITVIWKG